MTAGPVLTAEFRFYGELGDFLPPAARQRTRRYRFRGNPSVKDAIEAQHVPHTEVEVVVANGAPVGFGYHLGAGDRVAVYPPFRRLALPPDARVRPPAPDPPAFLLDVHLGRLARLLRLVGVDAAYDPGLDDPAIARRAEAENRVVLTRDRRLLHRRRVVHGYCVRSDDPEEQLGEVLERYGLRSVLRPFSRCLACNGVLRDVPKDEVVHRLEPKTRRYYHAFRRCERCGRVFWRGSHAPRLDALVARVAEVGGRARGNP